MLFHSGSHLLFNISWWCRDLPVLWPKDYLRITFSTFSNASVDVNGIPRNIQPSCRKERPTETKKKCLVIALVVRTRPHKSISSTLDAKPYNCPYLRLTIDLSTKAIPRTSWSTVGFLSSIPRTSMHKVVVDRHDWSERCEVQHFQQDW